VAPILTRVPRAPHGREQETRDKSLPQPVHDDHGDHFDLARGIALGIVVGVVMWGLAAFIVWAMLSG